MAKSIFINGTRVLSKWLNSIYGGGAKDVWAAATVYAAGDVIKLSGGEILRAIAVTGDFKSGATEPTAPGALRGTVVDNNVTWELFGGHLHDGLSIDGSAPKVLLTSAAEVTGLLPIANIAETIDNIVSSGSFPATFPTAQTMTIYYQLFQSGIVRMWWNGITGLVSGTDHQAAGGTLPAPIRPTTANRTIPFVIFVGASPELGYLIISTAGGFYFASTAASTAIDYRCIHYVL
jgi:hypothetical protein